MGAAAVLTVFKDGEKLREHRVEGAIELGRADGCVIRLDDRAISRRHATLKPAGQGVQIENRSDFAPIRVNGAECKAALLKQGDWVEIGPYVLRVTAATGDDTERGPNHPVVALAGTDPAALAPTLDLEPVATTEAARATASPAGAGPEPFALDAGTEVVSLDVAQASGQSPEPEKDPGFSPPLASPDFSTPSGVATSENASSPGAASDEASVSSPVFEMDSGFSPAPQGEGPALAIQPDFGSSEASASMNSMASVDTDGATKLTPSAKLHVRIVVGQGTPAERAIESKKDEIVIGRSKTADVSIDDKKASRQHAVIRRAGAAFVLKDLDSANGTALNGQKISGERELQGGDVIRIGATEMVFNAVSAEYASQAAAGFAPVPDDAVGGEPAEPVFGAVSDDGGAAIPFQRTLGGSPIPAAITRSIEAPAAKQSLLARFRALPPRRQAIWATVIVAGLALLLFEDPEPTPRGQQGKSPDKSAAAKSGAPPGGSSKEGGRPGKAFEQLAPEQKEFVKGQHALAFGHLQKGEFDKAVYEVRKIFEFTPDYDNSRDIERFALEGKRQLEAREKEKRKKEEEARLQARIEALEQEAGGYMKARDYERARAVFPQLLALDPENARVAGWRGEMEKHFAEQEAKEARAREAKSVNDEARAALKAGLKLRDENKLKPAWLEMRRAAAMNPPDKKLARLIEAAAADTQARLNAVIEPLLGEAKQAESAHELAKSYKLYERIVEADPEHAEAKSGMDRARGALHEAAKVLYTEAVLAESYSDFEVAKQKFRETLNVAPRDDIYHERAKNKLSRYSRFKEDQISGGGF